MKRSFPCARTYSPTRYRFTAQKSYVLWTTLADRSGEVSLKPGHTVLEGSAVLSRDAQPAKRETAHCPPILAGFRERRIGDVQALFAKPGWG